MEIQRRDTTHLEIILDARTLEGHKQEIADLDTVIRNWTDKCSDAETCTVILQGPPDQTAELSKLARKGTDLLENAYEVAISFTTREFPSQGNEDSDSIKSKKSHLKDLIMLAVVDGKFEPEEQQIIQDIGLKLGLTERQINSIYNECVLNPDAIESVAPTNPQDRLQHLADLCRIILADGELHDWESVLIFPLAARMGFDADDITKMLDDLFESQ